MLNLPRELIVHISTFVSIIDIRYDDPECNYEYVDDENYPMWNLYATCKSFQWMLDLECLKLCGDESIVTMNINRVYKDHIMILCLRILIIMIRVTLY